MDIFITSKFLEIDGIVREFAGPRIKAIDFKDANTKCPRGYKVVGRLIAEVDGDIITDYEGKSLN